jgi:hypothetical protein
LKTAEFPTSSAIFSEEELSKLQKTGMSIKEAEQLILDKVIDYEEFVKNLKSPVS